MREPRWFADRRVDVVPHEAHLIGNVRAAAAFEYRSIHKEMP
jgi:hypothetical protein